MYRVYFRYWHNGEYVGEGVSAKEYVRAGNAKRAAEQMCYDRDGLHYEVIIAESNPWADDALPKKYKVYYDYKIGGKYYTYGRIIRAESEKDACSKLKAKHLPGYSNKPYHVRAEPYEDLIPT